jgi:hypothetical protein
MSRKNQKHKHDHDNQAESDYNDSEKRYAIDLNKQLTEMPSDESYSSSQEVEREERRNRRKESKKSKHKKKRRSSGSKKATPPEEETKSQENAISTSPTSSVLRSVALATPTTSSTIPCSNSSLLKELYILTGKSLHIEVYFLLETLIQSSK